MGIVLAVQNAVAEAISARYGTVVGPDELQVTETKPEFEGDYTVVLFALLKKLKKSPEEIGRAHV